MDVDLVARRRLQRQAHGEQLPAFGAAYFATPIGRIQAFGWIAGVEVREDVRDRAVLPLVAGRRVVPEAILEDRAADAEGEVPLFDQLAGGGESGRPQLVAVIAADHSLADARDERGAADRVAAAAWHDAQRRATDFRFAEAARGRRHNLLRVGDVGDVSRHATAAEPGADV